jgi:hypothetical protein
MDKPIDCECATKHNGQCPNCPACEHNRDFQGNRCGCMDKPITITTILEEFEKKFIKISMWELVPNTPRKIMTDDAKVAELMANIQSFITNALKLYSEAVRLKKVEEQYVNLERADDQSITEGAEWNDCVEYQRELNSEFWEDNK